MNYTTRQDVLDFVEDNNVKFVRFAFTDIFGTQKNIAVLASDLPKALDEGVCFDGSAVPGLMHVEESDLVLRPDLATITIRAARRPALRGQLPRLFAADLPAVQADGPGLQRGGRVRVLPVRDR